MKKFIMLFLMLMLFVPMSFAGENPNLIFKVNSNNTPIRYNPNDNARRYTHLNKGVFLRGSENKGEFYKVKLNNEEYWVAKNKVNNLGYLNKKIPNKIKKIKFREDKNFYYIIVKEKFLTPWYIDEKEKTLSFEIFDADYNLDVADNSQFKCKKGEFGNLIIKYKSTMPIFGYDVETNRDTIIFKIRKSPEISKDKPLKNVKIMIDAGHGGIEPGVVAFGVREKDINLQISKQLKKELNKNGAKTYLTRRIDKKVPLYERIQKAKNKKAHILISIHQNSLPNPKNVDKKHGVGVYYYNKQAYSLAENIQSELVSSTGFKPDGVFNASFAITRATNPVSVLVECGYLIHKEEMTKLVDKDFQKLVASAISNGIKKYLAENF